MSITENINYYVRNAVSYFLINTNVPHFMFHIIRPFSVMTFGQKIIHKAKFDTRPLLTNFADKVAIKDRVNHQIGPEYIIPNYKVLDNSQDLNFSEYPREYVLKSSHASGAGFIIHEGAKRNSRPLKHDGRKWSSYYEIHPDDLKINEGFIKEKSADWLKSIYAPGKEYCYAAIPPKLIVEKYIQMKSEVAPSDYRFYVFHGEVKFFRIARGASNNYPNFAFNELGKPLYVSARHDDVQNQAQHPKLSKQYKKMIKLAETLAVGVDFVRVDFYLTGGQIYFSEITNYPLGGNIEFLPKSFNKQVSSFWTSFDICSFKRAKPR